MSQSANATVRRIVVGVDGSPASSAALRWAISEAELTGDTVLAVIAWQYPIAAGGYGWAPVAMDDSIDMETIAEKTLAQAIDEAVKADSAVTIERRVVDGDALGVFLAAAADLLVLGSRGHGTFAEALLGSVSQHCVHHAKCPVVIVRGRHN